MLRLRHALTALLTRPRCALRIVQIFVLRLTKEALDIDISALRALLGKPLRPSWITHDHDSLETSALSNEYHNVMCCTASHHVEGAEMSENGYIQGAGDDSEGWSRGLTPPVFWRHKEQLLGATEEDLTNMISQLLQENKNLIANQQGTTQIGSTNLYLGNVSEDAYRNFYDGIVFCTHEPLPRGILTIANPGGRDEESRKHLHLPCSDGKNGSRALRAHLARVPSFVASLSTSCQAPKILFASSDGKDLSVGVALTVLCLFFDDDCKPLLTLMQSWLDLAFRCPHADQSYDRQLHLTTIWETD